MNALHYKDSITQLVTTLRTLCVFPHQTASFVALWYYIELLNNISIAIFFYSPMLIAVIGVLVGILLSLHIIGLYLGKTINYYIQLLLMDIHIAYAVGMTVAAIFLESTWYTLLIVVIRDMVALIEIVLVFTMTGEN